MVFFIPVYYTVVLIMTTMGLQNLAAFEYTYNYHNWPGILKLAHASKWMS